MHLRLTVRRWVLFPRKLGREDRSLTRQPKRGSSEKTCTDQSQAVRREGELPVVDDSSAL